MKNNYLYQFTAFSDAAGKYDPSATKEGNEDNMFYSLNLSGDTQSSKEKWFSLDEFGILLAVADGMGGMNAGEVASQIAVDTVKYFFSKGKITNKIAESDNLRQAYLEKVIVAADEQIKNMAAEREDRKGMGSTLVLLWMYKDRVTISWIGDSRAYRYNSNIGLQLLSKDHSYVQELVDKGIITYEQSFDHPQGNIVTRSLGDPSKSAQPESRHYKVYDGDILMLCSDGLSGVLRDIEIENIIGKNTDDIEKCQEQLWHAAKNADWYDNVTTLLCKVKGGELRPTNKEALSCGEIKPYWKKSVHFTRKQLSLSLVAFLSIIILLIILLFMNRGRETIETVDDMRFNVDSCEVIQGNKSPNNDEVAEENKLNLPQELPIRINKDKQVSLDSIKPKISKSLTPIKEEEKLEDKLTPLSDTIISAKNKIDTLTNK